MGRVVFTVIAVLTIEGCVSPSPREADNVMMLSPPCDTVPPVDASAMHFTPELPGVARSTESGTVIGTVVEAVCGARLSYADVVLRPSGRTTAAPRPTVVDSVGGFALRNIAPGEYMLRIRAFNHRLEDRSLEIRAGGIDTVRAALRYFVCHGY